MFRFDNVCPLSVLTNFQTDIFIHSLSSRCTVDNLLGTVAPSFVEHATCCCNVSEQLQKVAHTTGKHLPAESIDLSLAMLCSCRVQPTRYNFFVLSRDMRHANAIFLGDWRK